MCRTTVDCGDCFSGRLSFHELTTEFYELFRDLDVRSVRIGRLPSCCLGIPIDGLPVNTIEKKLRQGAVPVIARIEADRLILDPRTIRESEFQTIKEALAAILENQDKL